MRRLLVSISLLIIVTGTALGQVTPVAIESLKAGVFYDEDSPLFVFGAFANWTRESNVSSFNRFSYYSDSSGGFHFTCVCSGFTVYTRSQVSSKAIDIAVDNTVYGFDIGTGSVSHRHPLTVSGLDFGVHFVFVTAPAATARFYFDGVYVHSEPADSIEINLTLVPEQPEHRHNFTVTDLSNEEHNVAFDFVLTPGDLLTGSLLFALVIFGMQQMFMKFNSGSNFDE